MSRLLQIENFIRPCAHVISMILHTDVTVVDDELNRIYGTASYHTESVPSSAAYKSSVFFERLLKSGNSKLVTDISQDPYCNGCQNHDKCTIKAEMGYPLNHHGDIVGVIGISAFTDEAASYIKENHRKLNEFLKYIAILISNQLDSTEQEVLLQNKLTYVTQYTSSYNLLGNSPQLLNVLRMGQKVAASDSTVLITGESGTGKEQLARFLHANSRRKDGPMITINCAAIPENLVESELFGYESGSFTGAKKGGSIGKFELADKGTIFLDEIGELPLLTQTKLLRVLQEHTIERIGGRKSVPVDIRVIAATNQNLENMVEQHTFRQDLYYRLNVIPMELPPLRERGDDITLLAEHFLWQFNRLLHKNLQGFDYQAEALLKAYNWPGNIRELRNIVEFLVNIAEGSLITAEDLPSHLRQGQKSVQVPSLSLSEIVSNYERSVLKTFLKDAETREEKLLIAQKLGLSQATLYRKMRQYEL